MTHSSNHPTQNTPVTIFLESFLRTGVLVALAMLMVVLFALKTVSAATATQPATPGVPKTPAVKTDRPVLVRPGDMNTGGLLLRSKEPGMFIEAPRLATDIVVDITGPIARTRITQRFMNPADGWIEGVYVFPLPEGSAVDTLKMQIGDRLIEGKIKPRAEAKQIYEDAKRAGKKASLLEQERANIFTNSVANIGPGETVVVQIEYQETIRQDGGAFSLRLPLVVAPRYNPRPIVHTVKLDRGSGWGVTDPVADRDRISPPVLDPAKHEKTNPVTIAITLAAGFPVGDITSAHHPVAIEESDGESRTIRLKDEAVPADKDFELTWTAKAGAMPTAALFRENVDGTDYLLAFVMPPKLDTPVHGRPPREIVFVIDTSGSMGGQSIRQARDSLQFALSRLTPRDRFNIVRFNDGFDMLFADARRADPENLSVAKSYVDRIEAGGGTEMLPALRAALRDGRPADSASIRQVVFLTDGAIGNEQQLFKTIASQRGRSRVFTVGIGSAPNSFFMTRAAEIGRGTFTHVGSEAQVKDRMTKLFTKLENPIVTDLAAHWSTTKVRDISPDPLPDLYRGEPIVLAARADKISGALAVSGMFSKQPWRIELPLDDAKQGSGIGKLWARRAIAKLEARTASEQDIQSLDKNIETIALEHHLVSRLTSLVAVDVTPSRPDGTKITARDVPLNLPDGWEFEKVFGDKNTVPMRDAGLLRNQKAKIYVAANMAASPAPMAAAQPTTTVHLPQTATLAERNMLIGVFTLLLALMMTVVTLMWRKVHKVSVNSLRRSDQDQWI